MENYNMYNPYMGVNQDGNNSYQNFQNDYSIYTNPINANRGQIPRNGYIQQSNSMGVMERQYAQPSMLNYNQLNRQRMQNGMMENRQEMGTTIKNEELISLQEAIQLIRKSVGDEKKDEMFYESIIRNAPTEDEKNILRSIRDDERKHNKILRQLYFKFTNQTLSQASEEITSQENARMTYREQLAKALFGELDAVVKYRRIMGAMPDDESYTLIMSIMTDELRHASKYNYLIHKAH